MNTYVTQSPDYDIGFWIGICFFALICLVTLSNGDFVGFLKKLANILRKLYSKIRKKTTLINDLEWEVEIYFSNVTKDQNSYYTFGMFIEIFSCIEENKIEIEHVEVGSLKAKIRFYFTSKEGKENITQILEGTRKFVTAKLEKEYVEMQKANSEKEKTDIEKQQIEFGLLDFYSEYTQRLRCLELESKETENELKKLELFEKKKNILSALLAEGIITNDIFKMTIQGSTFIDSHYKINKDSKSISDIFTLD